MTALKNVTPKLMAYVVAAVHPAFRTLFLVFYKGLAEIEIRDQGMVGRLIFSAQKVVFFKEKIEKNTAQDWIKIGSVKMKMKK